MATRTSGDDGAESLNEHVPHRGTDPGHGPGALTGKGTAGNHRGQRRRGAGNRRRVFAGHARPAGGVGLWIRSRASSRW